MLRTNTKKARYNLDQFIYESLQDEEKAPATPEEAKQLLAVEYYEEIAKHDNRIKAGNMSYYEGFKYWAQGLSRDTFNYYYNVSAVDLLGDILEETPEEKAKFTEAQAEEKLTALIYNRIYDNIWGLIR